MIKQAVIHAGGEGTRLRPVTYEIPKPLIPVRGQSIITWQAKRFAHYGVQNILVTIQPRWRAAFERWREEVRQMCPEVTVELWEETEPMGTLGALVYRLGDRFESDPVYINNGDELKGFDLEEMSAFHEEQKKRDSRYAITMALREVTNPSDYGVAEMEGPLIIRYREKPQDPTSNLVNSGLYIVEPRVFSEVTNSSLFLQFELDLFPKLADERRFGGCVLQGQWYDCGTMERWEKAIKEWQGGHGA